MYQTEVSARSCPRKHAQLFKCEHCQKCLLGPAELKRHVIQHDENREVFKCQLCHLTLVSQKAHDTHVKMLHNLEREFVCNLCTHRLKSLDSLQHHMKFNHPKVYHKCNFCTYTSRSSFKVEHHHLKTTHPEEFLALKGEPGVTTMNNISQKHTYLYIKKKNHARKVRNKEGKHIGFECVLCSKIIKSEHYMNLHIGIHKGLKDFQCPQCSKRFHRKFVLNMHMRVHNRGVGDTLKISSDGSDPSHNPAKPNIRIKCEICGTLIRSEYYMKNHIKIHTGQKDFECLLCPMKFSRKGPLKSHTRSMHDESRVLFPCTMCSRVTASSKVLAIHVSRSHPEGKKCYPCSICNNQLASLDSLHKHMELRHAKYYHKCNYCSFISRAFQNAESHVKKVHSKVVVLPGSNLGVTLMDDLSNTNLYNTMRKSKMVKIRELIANLPNISCNLCNQDVSSMDSLWQHMKIYHPDVYHKCKYCEVSARAFIKVSLHVKTVHQTEHPFEDSDTGVTYSKIQSKKLRMLY